MNIKKPVRVTHTFQQRLNAPPADVFPLLCPVREAEWVPGWNPRVVYTVSGHAEPDCIFITSHEGQDAVWTVTEFEPEELRIGFLKVISGLMVVRIRIHLHGDRDGASLADVSYTYTALSQSGQNAVRQMTAVEYTRFMQGWEHALNEYLGDRFPEE